MAETLGSLVDKLAIVNVRLWHLEDQRRDCSLPDRTRLEAADKVSVANAQRNALIDEFDQLVDRSIRAGEAPVCLKVKHYQGEGG